MLFLLGLLLLISEIRCGMSVKPQPIWNSTFTDKLKKDLLMNYDRFARPAHHENATNVDIKLSIRHIDINEQKSIMTLNGWTKFSWNDDKLKWNPADYGGLESVHMADHEVWQPDIVLYNSALGNDISHYGRTTCIVYHGGKVLWVPPSQFQVFCDLDLRKWPNDVQTCMIKVGSWTYSGNILDLQSETPELQLVIENPEWQITSMKSTRNVKMYACCTEPYVDIEYNITVARRSEMYKSVAFTPITIVVLSTLASFWLPSEAGEKIIINCFNAVILTIFIKYFSNLLPVSATTVPLVVCHYCLTLYLVCFALILGVVVIKIARNKNGNVPNACKVVIDSWYGSFLGVTNPRAKQKAAQELKDGAFDDHQTSDDHQIISSAGHQSGENEFYWSLLGRLIDRTAFLVYLVTFGVMALKHFL
ncbi:acetylcholine receptor subunit alpha-like 1 isoform X2 [Culicoides brevitarsis]|uniref:acetylcholine receptor subunit alpha-like 1 isoform X2 n=1 Tax=Culicoides brevitarsis TaxID=469753 RepID=UPI00307B66D2